MNDLTRQIAAEAQKAFADFHHYHATQAQRELTQSLLEVLQGLLFRFQAQAPIIGQQLSPKETDAAAANVRESLDVFFVRLKQGIKRLEKQTGKDRINGDARDAAKSTPRPD